MTGSQFDALSYEETRELELIDGQAVPCLSPTASHQEIGARVLFALKQYFDAGKIRGLAFQGLEFALNDRHRVRPDVCILLKERADYLDRDRVPVPISPDIAIEVISPNEDAGDVKVRNYLRNGVSEVWRIYAKSRTVEVDCGDATRTEKESLSSELLPGFGLRVASLFE